MPNIPFVYAGWDHWDRTRPLIDGRIKPEGLDLTYVVPPAAELGRRLVLNGEYDAGELWGISYIAMRSHGDDRFIGVPVFPSRSFRHGYIFVHSDAGIQEPRDLVGKRVGVGEYIVTATVWVRAILQHDYGIDPSSITWVVNPVRMHAPYDPPPEIPLLRTSGEKSLEAMLLDGEIDALISPARPRALLEGDPRIRRLFPNYRELEHEYFQRTGFFPIMHIVGVKRELYERYRWIPGSLLNAFEEAKRLAWSRLRDTGALAVGLPWLPAELEEVDQLFGGDPFPYGFEANYRIIDAMAQYAYEQGIAARKMDPEELFAPETIAAPVSV